MEGLWLFNMQSTGGESLSPEQISTGRCLKDFVVPIELS